MKSKCVKVYLDPNNVMHCQIMEYLDESKLSNSRAMIKAVLDGLRYRAELDEEKRLFQEVRETIRECLNTTSTQGSHFDSDSSESDEEAEVSPLDFLSALGV